MWRRLIDFIIRGKIEKRTFALAARRLRWRLRRLTAGRLHSASRLLFSSTCIILLKWLKLRCGRSSYLFRVRRKKVPRLVYVEREREEKTIYCGERLVFYSSVGTRGILSER